MITSAIAVLVYLSALVGVLVGVAWLSVKWAIPAELRRKMIHISMGCAAMTFPFVFESPTPVIVLALLIVPLLLFLRRFPSLHCANSIHGVARKSGGEFYFVLGVLFAFIFAGENLPIYLTAVATLTFADSAAALFPIAVGKPVGETAKSPAGSLAFFVIAFVCAYAFLGGVVFPGTLLATSLGFAISLTCVEALGKNGFDNLTIPLAGVSFCYLPLHSQTFVTIILILTTIHLPAYGHRPISSS